MQHLLSLYKHANAHRCALLTITSDRLIDLTANNLMEFRSSGFCSSALCFDIVAYNKELCGIPYLTLGINKYLNLVPRSKCLIRGSIALPHLQFKCPVLGRSEAHNQRRCVIVRAFTQCAGSCNVKGEWLVTGPALQEIWNLWRRGS